jgi:hypothetical protein
MGNWFSKSETPEEKQIRICNETNIKLTEILQSVENLIKTQTKYDINTVKILTDKYNEANTYVQCNEAKPDEIKQQIKIIYQNYILQTAKTIYEETKNINCDLISEDLLNNSHKFNGNNLNLNNTLKILSELQKLDDKNEIIIGYINDVTNRIKQCDKKIAEIDGNIKMYKKIMIAQYLSIGCTNQTDNKIEYIQNTLNEIYSNNYLELETYKFLMKFSEFVPLLYPIDIPGNNYTNIDLFYANFIPTYINTDFKQRLGDLMLYYADNVSNNIKENNITLYQYFVDPINGKFTNLKQMILKSQIKTDEQLFNEIKKILKEFGLNHWKSIKFYADISQEFNTNVTHLPNNYPIYNDQIEILNSIIYTLNILINHFGDDNSSMYNDSNPFKYEELLLDKYTEVELIDKNLIGRINTDEYSNRLNNFNEVCNNTMKYYSLILNYDLSYIVDNTIKKYVEDRKLSYDEFNFKLGYDEFEQISSIYQKYAELKTNKKIIYLTISSSKTNPTYNITQTLLKDEFNNPNNLVSELSNKAGMFGSTIMLSNGKKEINFTLPIEILFNLMQPNQTSYIELYRRNNNFIYNSSDYLTYSNTPLNKNQNINSLLTYYVFSYAYLTNKYFGLIIPLVPKNISNYMNSINDYDFQNCNKFGSNEEKYNHMFQRSTIYPDSNNSF